MAPATRLTLESSSIPQWLYPRLSRRAHFEGSGGPAAGKVTPYWNALGGQQTLRLRLHETRERHNQRPRHPKPCAIQSEGCPLLVDIAGKTQISLLLPLCEFGDSHMCVQVQLGSSQYMPCFSSIDLYAYCPLRRARPKSMSKYRAVTEHILSKPERQSSLQRECQVNLHRQSNSLTAFSVPNQVSAHTIALHTPHLAVPPVVSPTKYLYFKYD